MMTSGTDDNMGFYNISKYLHFITQRGIRKSMLIIPQQNYNKFLNLVETLLKNSFFYVMTFDDATINWKQILTLNNSTNVISNDLKFDDFGRIIEHYDLQGKITVNIHAILYLQNINPMGYAPPSRIWIHGNHQRYFFFYWEIAL